MNAGCRRRRCALHRPAAPGACPHPKCRDGGGAAACRGEGRAGRAAALFTRRARLEGRCCLTALLLTSPCATPAPAAARAAAAAQKLGHGAAGAGAMERRCSGAGVVGLWAVWQRDSAHVPGGAHCSSGACVSGWMPCLHGGATSLPCPACLPACPNAAPLPRIPPLQPWIVGGIAAALVAAELCWAVAQWRREARTAAALETAGVSCPELQEALLNGGSGAVADYLEP